MRYKLGIVLSGGGSRGLAHAGVLRALAENGIEPDCIAGTSAGALVGALHASGRDSAEILEFFDDVHPFRFSRLALNKPGVIDSEKLVGSFEQWFPDDSFEALRKPLFVTGTDLVSGRLEVWSSGALVRPLLASSAVPFVISPTRVDDRLYVDGGIVNNFPVEPLFGLCDTILGSPRDAALGALRERPEFDSGGHPAGARDRHVPRLEAQVPPRRPGDLARRSVAVLDLRHPATRRDRRESATRPRSTRWTPSGSLL